MLPVLAVVGENTIAQERIEVVPAEAAEFEIVELGSKDGLDVLRVCCYMTPNTQDFIFVRPVTHLVEAAHDHRHELLGPVGPDGLTDTVDAVRQSVGQYRRPLAA